jgi:CHAD domain-containing protein
MSTGKWIDGLTNESSAANAARVVLSARLTLVRDKVPLVLQSAREDSEHVHQLRVGTRRARAALDVFSPWLRPKAFHRARRACRRIRRAVGQARDLDVFIDFLAQLESRATAAQTPGLLFAIGFAASGRAAAQRDILGSADLLENEVSSLVEHVEWMIRPSDDGPDVRLGQVARLELQRRVEELRACGKQGAPTAESLHQTRIAGKRLRYAMEVFACCFPAAFRDRSYASVEQMQEFLGKANDCHVGLTRMVQVQDAAAFVGRTEVQRLKSGILFAIRSYEQELKRARREFLKWRSQWRRSGEPFLLALLSEPALRNGAAARKRGRLVSRNGR